MNIEKIITLLTTIPWIIIFYISIIKNINHENYQTFSFKYVKKNFLKIFRLDTLFLIVAFIYFASFKKIFVDRYLFTVMCLYLCVNSFYEPKKKLPKNFIKNNLVKLILLIIIMALPFIIYFINNDVEFVYKMMLFYLFFNYFIILIINGISKLFKRK